MMNNIRLVVELVVPLLPAAAAVVTAPGRLKTIGGINELSKSDSFPIKFLIIMLLKTKYARGGLVNE